MLRKLGLIIALSSALVIGKVNALGMGEIRVKSALNEPLHAEIQLFQVKNLSPLQIKSRMADLNDFALSGLATQRALTDVRFQTRVRANGTGRIILTSKLPVTEPFMNFLVEVNWPNGRLIREYTLLLDPPSYQSQKNSGNFSARDNIASANSNKAKAAFKVKKSKAASSKAKRVPKDIKLEKGQYYVNSKDTLWDIAIANRPSKKISPQRMMVLMQRKNPQAFPNANINVMTANVVIDLPTKAEIDALSAKDAQKEVNRQTKLWKSGNLPKVVAQAASTDKSAPNMSDKDAAAKSKVAKDQASMDKAAMDKAAKDKSMQEKAAADKMSKEAGDKAKTEGMTDPTADAAKVDANGQPVMTEKGMLNVVTPEEAAAKRDMQAKADAMAIAASKDSNKIAELLKSNAELDVKLALSQESIDKLERDNQELNKKLGTIVKQLEDINRLIMLKDEQLSVMQDELLDTEKDQQKKDKVEGDKSWLDRLLENPVGMATAGIGWLFAIIAGVFLLLRRKKKEVVEVLADEKSEPSISLPDDVIEPEEGLEELEELEELDDSADIQDIAGDVDDLDLDLDLDMDMELDETLEGTALDIGSSDEEVDDQDLAAELEAQLNTTDDDDDDDLDMLDGIDSLEFDLGEDEDTDLDLDEEPEDEEDDEEKRALAEFAAAMEAPDDEEENTEEVDVLESLDLDDIEIEESAPETAELEEDELEIDIDDELNIEMPESEGVSVEEDEVDISDIADQVTSLDELEVMEGLANDDLDGSLELDEELSEQLSEEPKEETADDSLEIELDEEVLEIDLDESDVSVEPEPEVENEVENEEELSLDGAVLEDEEDQQPPMDNALEDMLGQDIENDLAEDDLEIEMPEDDSADESAPAAKAQSTTEVLEEQLDELLASTDDEIALEAVAPEFDADNEEDIDLLSGEDGVRMKLDLARAYIEMGDSDGAKDIIKEVMDAGEADHLSEAQDLLDSIDSK